jgi:predicted DCC family thiol-disulfide oxidoreductase YuxK
VAAPNLPVLVFDGGCGFCTRSANWIERRLPASAGASVQPWQRLDLHALDLSAKDVARYAWWVEAGHIRRRGHHAIAAALRAVGGAWGVVGRVIDIPPVSWLAAGAYRLVASNRHRLRRFGTTPACANGRC